MSAIRNSGGDSATAEGAKNRLLENETKCLRMAIAMMVMTMRVINYDDESDDCSDMEFICFNRITHHKKFYEFIPCKNKTETPITK